jgi:aspartyl-tRNA(Asn)/glutamyl-tRNA(Gln) amidotransferase subunit A
MMDEFNLFNHSVNSSEGKFQFSVKDSICTKDMPTTAGSQILSNYTPRFDATVVEKLKKAGGVCVGKTAMDAFGFGSFSVNVGLDKKVPKNPLDEERVCGGSSGGAAGAVAALGENHIALGQSTGGSIACPAAFCGVVGLTPTYGRVSRYGLLSYANSLDKIGPITKTVQKSAEILEIISGADGKDATCVEKEKGFSEDIGRDISGLKIGIISEAFGEGVDTEIAESVRHAAGMLGEVEEVSLPITMKYGVSTYYLIALTEASTNLAKYCGLRYGKEGSPEGVSFNDYFSSVRSENFNKETKRRIILGTFARMAGYRDAYYLKAMKVRQLIIDEYKKLFEKYDVLISPSMPVIAPRFDEVENMTPMQQYMMDILTVGPNLAGMPHISIPCGKKDGMPIGMLIIGDHWNEKRIIQVANYYEKK